MTYFWLLLVLPLTGAWVLTELSYVAGPWVRLRAARLITRARVAGVNASDTPPSTGATPRRRAPSTPVTFRTGGAPAPATRSSLTHTEPDLTHPETQ